METSETMPSDGALCAAPAKKARGGGNPGMSRGERADAPPVFTKPLAFLELLAAPRLRPIYCVVGLSF